MFVSSRRGISKIILKAHQPMRARARVNRASDDYYFLITRLMNIVLI